jgi:hypothetical protein
MKYLRTLGEAQEKEGEDRVERAKAADLITLPDEIVGTNCGNCIFVDLETKMCKHPQVLQKVSERMCCVFWDAIGTKREWETEKEAKSRIKKEEKEKE